MNSGTVCAVLAVALSVAATARAQDSDVAAGEKLYVSQCKICHGDNSKAKTASAPVVPPRWQLAHAGAVSLVSTSDVPMHLAFAPPFGPNLRGVVGREAGSVPGFDYSSALLKALKGMVWTEGTLDWWLLNTQAWVPGVLMFYKQPDAEIRRKIIAYLKANP